MQQDKTNLKKLGKRIKTLREKTGKSLNSLVMNKGGITTATWSRIENGKVDAKFNTLVKVAAVLETSVENLLFNLELDYSLDDE